jgi:hypothetical protein
MPNAKFYLILMQSLHECQLLINHTIHYAQTTALLRMCDVVVDIAPVGICQANCTIIEQMLMLSYCVTTVIDSFWTLTIYFFKPS